MRTLNKRPKIVHSSRYLTCICFRWQVLNITFFLGDTDRVRRGHKLVWGFIWTSSLTDCGKRLSLKSHAYMGWETKICSVSSAFLRHLHQAPRNKPIYFPWRHRLGWTRRTENHCRIYLNAHLNGIWHSAEFKVGVPCVHRTRDQRLFVFFFGVYPFCDDSGVMDLKQAFLRKTMFETGNKR